MPSGFQAFGSAEGYVGSGTPPAAPPLAGPSLWLRADLDVDPSSTYVWPDKSGHGHDVSQSGANVPAAPAVDATLNNQLMIDFSGSSTKSLISAVWSAPLASPYTVMLIGYKIAGNKFGFDGLSAVNTVSISSDAVIFGARMINTASSIFNVPDVTSAAIVLAVFNGASSALYVSAVTPIATGTVGTSPLTGTTIGNDATLGTSGWKIAEVGVWPGALSAPDRLTLFTYATTRYAITIGP